MEKRWAYVNEPEQQKVTELALALNIDNTLAKVLVQRNIFNFNDAKTFFRPSLNHLHDPFLMQDMEKAIDRIDQSISSNEKVLIYGDYDVDGTTAVTLTYSFFKQFTPHIHYYIPDRHKEGYGISTQGIDYAKENGFTLIIALDCGIRSIDKIEYANSLGIDFIICDHHLPGNEIPKAIAVLDPKRIDCQYPFKELSGCGVGFKVAQAYCQKHNLGDELYEQFLDLCMVSVAADIVPIVDENRVLAYYGLLKLNENPSTGLKSLMQISGKTEKFDIGDVVFQLAPRINAAGRMGHASDAVKMMLSNDGLTADEQSFIVNALNTERKQADSDITAEALAMIEETPGLKAKKTTVVFHNTWNKGVIGIVASRLIETYYRPTIVLTESNGKYTGSARSVAGFDLYSALENCADLLEQFGGHKYAAGMTLKPENLHRFAEKFEQAVSMTITPDLLTPEVKVDSLLQLEQLNDKFYRILAQMAPFGPQHMAPVFVSHNVTFVGAPQIVGTKHLKLRVKQQNSTIFDTIGFNLGALEPFLKPNQPFSICYTVEENIWKDRRNLQLNIKDIKFDVLNS